MSSVPFFKAMVWTRVDGNGVDRWELQAFAPWEKEEAIAWAQNRGEQLAASLGAWAMSNVRYVNSDGGTGYVWERYVAANRKTGTVERVFTNERGELVAA